MNIIQTNINHIKNNQHGSALVLALVIMVAITAIIGVALTAMFLQTKFILREKDQIQALYMAEAGVQIALWYLGGNGGKGPYWRTSSEIIPLWEQETATVSVQEWGGFLQIHSIAQFHNAKKHLRVLVGEKPTAPFQQAVTIGKLPYPLVVSGKNKIVGDVTVSSKGVKPGSIKGRKFEGEKLVHGKIFQVENPQMPYFDNILFRQIKSNYEQALQQPSGLQIYDSGFITQKTITEALPLKQIYVYGDAVIHNVVLNEKLLERFRITVTGSLTISGSTNMTNFTSFIAGRKIFVQNNVRIKNAILYAANGIELSDDCRIEAQLISPDTILIKDRAVLDYPSVVYCGGWREKEKWHGGIIIADRAIVKGTVLFNPWQETQSAGVSHPFIRIGSNAKIVGAVFSQQNCELRGSVVGSIAAAGFFLYIPPTTYLNWLWNTTINRQQLPDDFLMPLYFAERPNLGILFWEEIK